MTSQDTIAQLRAALIEAGQPLVLVGMMGVGKTTIGRRLAQALELDFTDCDHAIEDAAGMSVSEIFAQYGESEFRAGERRVITRLLGEGVRVIATGGGAFSEDETRGLILESATSIWLDADLETLVERTSKRDTRPLLRGGNPAEILRELLDKRRPHYQQADIRIVSGSGPHGHVLERILEALYAHLALEALPEVPKPVKTRGLHFRRRKPRSKDGARRSDEPHRPSGPNRPSGQRRSGPRRARTAKSDHR